MSPDRFPGWPHWLPIAAQRPRMSPDWWPWVASRDSLTARLRIASPRPFSVRLLAQGVTRPRLDEAQALGLPHRTHVWHREVLLRLGDASWVAARSVAPLEGLSGARLCTLGERSLGSWLFRQPNLERGPIEAIRAPAMTGLGAWRGDAGPWGRRSLLRVGRTRILVQEFFLAAMAADLSLPSR
ncbi:MULTISPECIES: chorismate--pyruvate lyase family protein [Chromohalobacter]|uniref:chorismate--pyruvate lyase family protein n=1 Tax=Chromohalobacter TaxID=42054 RepID=UPI000FFEFAD0|nr:MULTISPECIES: chorismate lyase [Chromohalobacter]MBZ5875133.1 chorismate lyase [Chromohalobacter salexigens]MDO0945563.1 chorismate lyase [Chromohalobacter salexigens]NQY45672.1 chorismate lyase [Chromohalobacter sp.]NWO55254.1 chorismate lyase [Chromohalobacter salexigens]RXE46507.1 chorismate lyase [Chromohalobacter salexigens]